MSYKSLSPTETLKLLNSRSNQFNTIDTKDLESLYNRLVGRLSVCHALLMRFSRIPAQDSAAATWQKAHSLNKDNRRRRGL